MYSLQAIFAYLQLMRPANILTAIADILLGFAVSGSVIRLTQTSVFQYQLQNTTSLGWLILATIGLYGGGVVLNDVFDYKLDKAERPERPLPSGAASLSGAILLGILLLLGGCLAAFQVSWQSVSIALAIVVAVISYDGWAKHHVFFGPVNMGLCRGGNLCLGMSAVSGVVDEFWFLAALPLLYIGAITMISRGEVQGGNRFSLQLAVFLYALVIVFILGLSFQQNDFPLQVIPFLALFAGIIFPSLLQALKDLQAKNVFKAVKKGVLALIVMDAAVATSFAGWEYGIFVLFLLPLSMGMAKLFAVT